MGIYQHKKNFFIKYCDVDFCDKLKVSSALSLMQEVAGSSADELGLGYMDLKKRNLAFIVSNICCEFLQPITFGENVMVKTWPTPPTRFVFGREYQFVSEQGEICVNASSRWCLLDMETGRLQPSKVFDKQDYSTYNTTKLFEDVKWKIPTVAQSEGELSFSLKIANSEYDHNMHVNNAKYADYCFNCFTVSELREWKLKNFSISYIKQCREGEVLRFYRKEQENHEWLVTGFNEKDEVVVQARIGFAS